MDSSNKLYISIAVLALLGGGLYLQNKGKKTDEASHSYATKVAELPKLEVSEDTLKAVDRIELRLPAKVAGEKGADGNESKEDKPAETIILVKSGEEHWNLESPIKAVATASNVKSLLDNVKALKVIEGISNATDTYDRWGVSDEKAVHAVIKKGSEVVLDVYFGDDGSRGQMARLGGKDGVIAIKGYSKYSFNRDTKGWRDRGILKFDDKEVAAVSIENEHGAFNFKREADKWDASFKEAPKGKSKAKGTGKPIDKLKTSKIDDMVRAYKALSAADFGDEKKPGDVGLEPPKGSVTFTMKDGTQHVVNVGDTAEGTNRWAKTNASDAIFTLSSWTSDWAVAEVSRFQEAPPKPAKPSEAPPGGLGEPGEPGAE